MKTTREFTARSITHGPRRERDPSGSAGYNLQPTHYVKQLSLPIGNRSPYHYAHADYGPDEHRLIKRCRVMADRIFDRAWVHEVLAA